MSESARLLRGTSDEHELKANSSGTVYTDAANADADYKKERAKAVLRFKSGVERMSQAEAETRADADDRIADLYRRKAVTEALAKAHKDKLAQLKEREASRRTAVVDEREVDRLHANRIGGRP